MGILVCLLAITQVSFATGLNIIPVPTKCVAKKGEFTVNEQTVIALPNQTEEMKNAAMVFTDLFSTAAGFTLKVSDQQAFAKSNIIRCTLNSQIAEEEGYRLRITPSTILLEAKTPQGIFYGFQTLRQLLPAAIESSSKISEPIQWTVPCAIIEDAPVFSYRGLMLDVARHFKSKEFVKRYIDLLAFHKLNTFHWHLTEDQGWRIEIKKYPKLTSVGAFRDKTLIGHGGKRPFKYTFEKYGGFYTQEEIKEVVAYAKKRFVEVIPEIEMPGHAVAALAAYPEYSCSGGPFEVESRWGVFNGIFWTKEATVKFLVEMWNELIPLFPSAYIHIGGDEAPKVRWKRCAACQERMKKEGIPDEEHLQSYFINRMEAYLNKKGKKIIGWDEILEGDVSKRATVMSWRGVKGGIRAAQEGRDVIMSPNSHFYFDHYQSDPKTQPLAIGGFLPLSKVYSYNPIPAELTSEQARKIKGVQANMWSEYMPTEAHTEYMGFPRAAALAEVSWSTAANRNFDSFYQRLQSIEQHYDVMGVNYCKTHKPEKALRLMSYNIRNAKGLDGITDYQRIANVLNGIAPDVVAVQELDSMTTRSGGKSILEEIAKRTNRHATFAPAIPYQGGKYGVGLLSVKAPLRTQYISLPGKEEARVLLMAEFEEYVVCCTHLSLTPEDQLASVAIIRNAVKEFGTQQPVLLAGYMNSTPVSSVQKEMNKHFISLNDTKQETIPSDFPKECIDYIYQYKTANRLPVVRRQVMKGHVGSDHLPLFVDIQF